MPQTQHLQLNKHMPNEDWMTPEQREDWERGRQETKDYITERVKDGVIEPGTFIEPTQVADWTRANNRYNQIVGNGWISRARRNGNANLSGDEIANVDAVINELNAIADRELENKGYYRNEGSWYDSYGRECNDRGERY